MELAIHRAQCSPASIPSKPVSCSKGTKLKKYATSVRVVGRTYRCSLLKHNICLSVGASHIQGSRLKPLRISAFQGGGQKDESGGRANGSRVSKNNVKISYVRKEAEETITESSNAPNVPLPCTDGVRQRITGSPVIRKLFKKWLTMLHTQPPSQEADETGREDSPSENILDTQNGTQIKESSEIEKGYIVKAVWSRFMQLDVTIKVPLLIFVPFYLAVNVIYGSKVSKELTPLWVIGPLVAALYVQMIKGLVALYVFTFKQTVEVVKSIPVYLMAGFNFIASGKLIWKSLASIDYKKLSRRKLKEFKGFMVDKGMDFLESIWPFYCRTIRFLKKANLL